MDKLTRIFGAVALLALTAFCVFGFLASYEYHDVAKRLPWQIGYGVLGLVCLGDVVMLLRPRGRRGAPGNTDSSR